MVVEGYNGTCKFEKESGKSVLPKCPEGMDGGTEGRVKKTCGGERRLEVATFKWTMDHGICTGE